MNVPDQVDERKDKIPMQTSEQSWLSISQKMKKKLTKCHILIPVCLIATCLFNLVLSINPRPQS